MEQQEPQMNPCACGCGTLVAGTWKRGHSKRGVAGFRPLPDPGAPDSAFDFGLAEPTGQVPGQQEFDFGDELDGQGDELDGDELDGQAGEAPRLAEPGPAHTSRSWRRKKPRAAKAGARPRPPRLTASVRTDVDAKVSFALEIPGRVWQARDPVCGGAFVEARPEISAALTEIICNSPDLLAWFMGAGGGYLLYLNLMAALWPVITLWMAHHIYHTVDDLPAADEAPQAYGYGQYAA